ncbi:unnamed protein product [Malus baccata var. baccata]
MWGVDLVSLICIFSSLPSTRSFGNSLALGSIGTSNSCESILRMGDPLGSSRLSSQKQNRKGVVGAQSGQYRVTMESSSGCDGGPGRDVIYTVT